MATVPDEPAKGEADIMTTTAWTVYQAPSGRWIARNARGRDFTVRNTREEAEQAIEAHKQRINTYGRKS